MRELHLSILQELARLEPEEEREAAIMGILNLLEDIMDGKLLLEVADIPEMRMVIPFEVQILWNG